MRVLPEVARHALEAVPPHWGKAPLKHLADINAQALPDNTDPDFRFRYIDIGAVDPLLGATPGPYIDFASAPSRARRIVRPNDILVSTVRTYLRAIAPAPESTDALIASTGFAVVSPRKQIHPGFLKWWLQSAPFVEDVVARSVGVGYPATTAAEVGTIYVPIPSWEEQKRIDAMLTSECAAIDRLVTEQLYQLELLEEHLQTAQDEVIRKLADEGAVTGSLTSLPRLKHRVSRVTVGIVVTPSKWYAPMGAPALRGLNIRPGRVSDNELVFITEEGNAHHAKSRLQEGDVVVVRTGNAGAASVVPEWAIGGNAIDLLLVRPGPDLLPKYVELLINSRLVRDQVTQGSVGALQSHFNVAALKNVRVVVPSLLQQRAAVEEADGILNSVESVRVELMKQVELLGEHRQALITAAVTGQIKLEGR